MPCCSLPIYKLATILMPMSIILHIVGPTQFIVIYILVVLEIKNNKLQVTHSLDSLCLIQL